MRKIYSIIVIVLLLSSCSTTIHQLHMDCNKDTKSTFKSITTILMREGFQIVQSDMDLGYLKAETASYRSIMTGALIHKEWVFQESGSEITASAIWVSTQQNGYGAQGTRTMVYCSDTDGANESDDWYWNIRNSLERLCPGITFSSKELNRTM